MVEEGAADQGLVDALAGLGIDIGTILPDGEREFMDMMADMLVHAQHAGTVRSDVDVRDIKTLLVGLQAMQRYRGDAEQVRQVFAVVRDGLAPS
jgi:hypothetical protein